MVLGNAVEVDPLVETDTELVETPSVLSTVDPLIEDPVGLTLLVKSEIVEEIVDELPGFVLSASVSKVFMCTNFQFQ